MSRKLNNFVTLNDAAAIPKFWVRYIEATSQPDEHSFERDALLEISRIISKQSNTYSREELFALLPSSISYQVVKISYILKKYILPRVYELDEGEKRLRDVDLAALKHIEYILSEEEKWKLMDSGGKRIKIEELQNIEQIYRIYYQIHTHKYYVGKVIAELISLIVDKPRLRSRSNVRRI